MGFKKPGKPHSKSKFTCSSCGGTNFTYQRRDNVPLHMVNYDVVMKNEQTGELRPYEQDIVGKMWLHVCMDCRYAFDKNGPPLMNGRFMKIVGDPEQFAKKLEEVRKNNVESAGKTENIPTPA